MKATFNRKRLLDAFATVASVAPSRTPKPVLQNVLMVVDGDGATLAGTDLEVGIRKAASGVDVEEHGSVLLPIDRFGSILRTSNDEQVVIHEDDGKIVVRTKSGRFTLNAEDQATFPDVPGFDGESYAMFVDHDLGKLIRRTHYATDQDSARYALGGALLDVGDGSASFVATDGRRLAKATCGVDVVGDMGELGMPIVPIKAMRLIERSIPNNGSQVHVAVQKGRSIMVRTDDAVIYARLVEGRFPAYGQVIPESFEVDVPFKVGELRSAISMAAICLDRESTGVQMDFGPDALTLSANTADVGQSRVTLPYATSIPGLARSVTLSAEYAADVLKSLDDDLEVVVELGGKDEPVVFREGDGLTAVIMPIVAN